MTTKLAETLTGVAFIVIAIGFLVFAYQKSAVSIPDGYSVRAEFTSVGGLEVGADVRIAGIKVGRVSDVMLNQDWFTAIVTMDIAADIALPSDTRLGIGSDGLLGNNHVIAEPGSGDYVSEGHLFVDTQEPVDLMKILSRSLYGAESN